MNKRDKQNIKINQHSNLIKTKIDKNFDLQTKKDSLELVFENVVKKYAPGEIEELKKDEIDSDIRTINLSLENNERTLSNDDLLIKLDSLDIDNNLKLALTNKIKKHKPPNI